MLLPPTAIPSVQAASSGESATGSQWLGHFIQRTLSERRVRASTLEAYALDVTKLSRWAAAQHKDLLRLDPGDLARYVSERLEEGAPASTVSRHLSSCRRFFAFLVSEGVLPANPALAVQAPRVRRHQPRLVPDDLLEKLLRPGLRRDASARAAYRTRRDHAIVWMLYGTRLGISDIRLLCWPQIDEQWHVIRVPLRNGDERSYILDRRLLGALRELRNQVAAAGFKQLDSAYCFLTASGLPMTRQALCHVIRKRARECGVEGDVTPSALRQTGRLHQMQRSVVRPALLAV